MSKTTNYLEKQLSTEFKQDAEDCLIVYNHLKDMNNGSVWQSQWNPLVSVIFKGFPSDERRYELTAIGRLVLKGIEGVKNEH